MAPVRVTVTIKSSAGADGPITVSDGLRQVLDFFELLSNAENNEVSVVGWRLVSISKSSPLTATAESYSKVRGYPTDEIARNAANNALSAFEDISQRRHVPPWVQKRTLSLLKNIYERNTDVIGETDISISSEPSRSVVRIIPRDAHEATRVIEVEEANTKLLEENFAHTEFGSVEGYITDTTTYYGSPAIRIRERLRGVEVVCVLDEELAAKIGSLHNWDEVWRSHRVIASGELTYRVNGTVARVVATSLETINPPRITRRDLADPTFTNGLSPTEHLANLWSGDVD